MERYLLNILDVIQEIIINISNQKSWILKILFPVTICIFLTLSILKNSKNSLNKTSDQLNKNKKKGQRNYRKK